MKNTPLSIAQPECSRYLNGVGSSFLVMGHKMTIDIKRVNASLLAPFTVSEQNLLSAHVKLEFILPDETEVDSWVTAVTYSPATPETRAQCNDRLIAKAWTKLETYWAQDLDTADNLFIDDPEDGAAKAPEPPQTPAIETTLPVAPVPAVPDHPTPNFDMITKWPNSSLDSEAEAELLAELQALEREFAPQPTS